LYWWKESFEKINGELELIRQKRNALENLLNSGRISQTTYEYYSKELAELEEEIENRRKALVKKMNAKISDLENQLQVLEMFFVDIEISHAVGKIDEETYTRQRDALNTGLEFAKQELHTLKDTLSSVEPFKAEAETPTEQPTLTEQAAEETMQTPVEASEEKKVEEQVTVETAEPVKSMEITPEGAQPLLKTTEELPMQEALVKEAPVEGTPVWETTAEGVDIKTAETETEQTEEAVET